MKTEIKALTGIRGIASFYVVFFHFYQFCAEQKDNNYIKTGLNENVRNFMTHGYTGVDVFFVLSAFVMTLSSRKFFETGFSWSNYKLFLTKRWIRVYPVYILTVLYGIFIVEHLQPHRIPNYILSILLLNGIVGGVPVLGHLWSMTAEWIAYLLFPVYIKILYFKNTDIWMLVCLLAGMMIYILSYMVFYHKYNLFIDYALEVYQRYPSTFRCLGEYVLGIVGFQLLNKKVATPLQTNFSMLILLIITVLLLCLKRYDFLIPITTMLILVGIYTDNNFLSKFLSSKFIYYLGLISYPVYLLNPMIAQSIKPIQSFLQSYFTNQSVIYLFLFAYFILFVIILSHLLTFFFEVPVLRHLNKRLRENKFPYLKFSFK